MIPFAYFGSAPDWMIIGGLILILFGGAKIPQFAKGLGEGLREFKKAMDHEPEPEPTGNPPAGEVHPSANGDKPVATSAANAGDSRHETGKAANG